MGDLPVIAKRLREARLKADLSQRQLGILAGIDEFSASPRINQYEKGKHVPDCLTAERLAKVLDVPEPYLYCRDDLLAQLILRLSRLTDEQRREILLKLTD